MKVRYNKKFSIGTIIFGSVFILFFLAFGKLGALLGPSVCLIIGITMLGKTAYEIDKDKKQIVHHAMIGPVKSRKDYIELLLENDKGYYINKKGKMKKLPSSFMYNREDYKSVVQMISSK